MIRFFAGLVTGGFIYAACSSSSKPSYGDDFTERRANANAEFQSNVKPWLTCDFPAKSRCEDDGDSMLWMGLHCTSANTYCHQVPKSQSADGQLWRSPRRVDKQTENAFSRDMAVGALGYFIKTKDIATFDKWVGFINVHEGKLCLNATDNRCDLTPNIRTLINLVGKHIGSGAKVDGVEMSYNVYYVGLTISARSTATGYPTHLNAVQAYLLQLMGHDVSELAKVVVEKQPNAFTYYVAKNYGASVNWVLEKMPKEQPANDYQWSFERANESEAWKETMGYEFEFILNKLGQQ